MFNGGYKYHSHDGKQNIFLADGGYLLGITPKVYM